MADLTGRQLGPYLLQRKLGQGGMGAVYVGVHQTLNVPRAIKVLLPTEVDEAVVERFVREGVISASLRHPNIVEIFDVGEQDDIHFLVMEVVEGDSLLHVLKTSGAMPLERTVALLRQMAEALDYAHSRGVVHRDIKPSNIIVGPNDHVTLIDFGIARAMDESRLTRVGVVVGTFEYMAPEVVTEGGGSPGADRYALGIVAFQMLTGRVPFTGESAHSIMYRQVHEAPPPPTRFRPDLPEPVEAALLRQLAKEPDARYPTSQAFVDALAASLTRQPMETEATSIADITRPGFERPTPGSGQTPLPRSGRVTRPVPSATLTPPGVQALPGVQPQPAWPQTARPTPAPPMTAPSYPSVAAAPMTAGAEPGTVLATPQAPPQKSSAGPIIGTAVVVAVLAVIVVLVSPLRRTITDLVAGAPPATATLAPQAKPVVTPGGTPAVTAIPAGAAAVQPKPGVTPAGPAAGAGVQPKPAITPSATPAPATATPAVPPTLTAVQRLAQAREASAAGNHPSALALLEQLRSANPALAGLDDAQYDVHMAFARSLLEAGNFDGSHEQFSAALKVRPNDGAAQAGRTQVILTKNYAEMEAAWERDQDRAIALLEENMQLDAGFRETRSKLYALLVMKADRLLGAGERDAAFPVLMRALEVLPEAGEAQKRLAAYTPTPVPTATPRPYVPPASSGGGTTAPPSSGGGTTPPPPPPPSGGGSSCPGGVCP